MPRFRSRHAIASLQATTTLGFLLLFHTTTIICSSNACQAAGLDLLLNVHQISYGQLSIARYPNVLSNPISNQVDTAHNSVPTDTY